MPNDVQVAPLDDKDIPICFQILSESFGHDAPFVDIYFPAHDTQRGQEQGSNRLTVWKHSSPASVFLKAVVSGSGGSVVGSEKIVGFAIWTLMTDIPPQTLEEAERVEVVWPDIEDRKFMSCLWSDYVKPRTQAVKSSAGKGAYGKYTWFLAISDLLNLASQSWSSWRFIQNTRA
jgi:hypothetical protein